MTQLEGKIKINTMITAKEFRINKFRNEKPFYTDKSTEYLMGEFAKLHVTAALKAAAKNAKIGEDHFNMISENVDKDSIINSYPLNNIK